jgi:hypothetical protein
MKEWEQQGSLSYHKFNFLSTLGFYKQLLFENHKW